jgi:uncharacterized membrane protein
LKVIKEFEMNLSFKGRIKKPKLDFKWIRNIRADAFWAILSYLHILLILPAIFRRKDGFVQYHVKQGVVLLAVWVLFFFSFFSPVLPWAFAFLILILTFSGIVNVILGKERPLPLIGKIATRL